MSARTLPLCALALAITIGSTALGQGIFLPSAGPVNRGMGGASVAVPLDSIGAFYWNPATLSALPSSEMAVGMELLLSDLDVTSTIPGLGSGGADSDSGATFLPSVGWVEKKKGSRLTWGMGVFAKAGFKTNYEGGVGAANPLSVIFGHVYSRAEFVEIAPAFSYAVSDNFAIGFGPTIGLGQLQVDPFVFDANTPAAPPAAPYPSGTGSRVHWGGGAQVGMYYRHSCNTTFGASLKSPQWFEDFTYLTQDEVGAPRTARFDLDLPLIASIGAGYYGINRTVIALDLRYFDYKNADGFGQQGIVPLGPSGLGPSFAGLGWSSIMSMALGAQYQWTDRTALRMGYSYHQNVMQDNDVLIATAAPLFQQHMFNCGGSTWINKHVRMNFAYTYVAENDVTGPFIGPGGPVPGSTITSSGNAHMLSMGATARY